MLTLFRSRLHEAADIIQKLQLIAQELPQGKFSDAIRDIEKKYVEIERALIEEFVRAHRSGDKTRMRDIAAILSHFRGYNQCVDAFIEQIQLQQQPVTKKAKDVFKEIVPLCETSWKLIDQVRTTVMFSSRRRLCYHDIHDSFSRSSLIPTRSWASLC